MKYDTENYPLVTKPTWPQISTDDVEEIKEKYPKLVEVLSTSHPLAVWLSDCEWRKIENVLYLDKESLHRIAIRKDYVNNLVDQNLEKVFIVWSDTTGTWYPFLHKAEHNSLSKKYAYFVSVDPKCPIGFLVLEREVEK